MSQLTAFDFIANRSEATPALWNRIFSTISDNIGTLNRDVSIGSFAGLTLAVDSSTSDYLTLRDSSALRSTFIIGSHTSGTADGLNIWDDSGQTMIVSFSKQSVRFFQPIVGPVFDTGGALSGVYNAATFIGSGSTLSGIQAAINQAAIDGIARVYLPASLYPFDASKISFITPVQMVREGGASWDQFDVRAYGAANTGSSADSRSVTSAIQAALNAIPKSGTTTGGTVFVPRGKYLLFSGVTSDRPNLAIQGEGAIGSELQQDEGATTIAVPANTVGFTWTGTGQQPFRGPVIRDIKFMSQSSASGGIRITQGNNFLLERVHCSDFTEGFGVLIDPAPLSSTQNGVLVNSYFGNNRVGVEALSHNAGKMTDCVLSGNSNKLVTRSGTTAVHLQGGTGWALLGNTLQDYSTLFHLENQDATGIFGSYVEGYDRVLSTSTCTGLTYIGSFVADSSTTVFSLGPATYRCLLIVPHIGSVGTIVAGASANTNENAIYINEQFRLPADAVMFFGDNASLRRHATATGALQTGTLYTTASLIVNSGDAGGELLFNSAQAVSLNAVTSGAILRSENTQRWNGPSLHTNGVALRPGIAWSSETSLGFYRSGASNIVQSYGTFTATIQASGVGGSQAALSFTGATAHDIKPVESLPIRFVDSSYGTVNFSIGDNARIQLASGGSLDLNQARLLSVRTLGASLDSTNMKKGEIAFTIISSGASLAIQSGSTIYYFTSSASTKAP